MDGLFNAMDLQNLSNLLNSERGSKGDSSDSDEELCGSTGRQKAGGDSRKNKQAPENPRFKVNIRRVTDDELCESNEKTGIKQGENSKAIDSKWKIWDDSEVPTLDTLPDDASLDPRLVPEYDISYQQAVTSEDIYLQMGGKTPSTVSCEDMLLTIHLPGEHKDSIDCDLCPQQLDIRSVKYRLCLPLPHPVLPHLSQANWDDDLMQLRLTLHLSREYDLLNF